jgi:polyphosphate glucokinase
MTTILGIDIGGTGIKGAPVDPRTGKLLADRHRIPTPQPATPDAVTAVVAELAEFFSWSGPAGATFPAVIKDGVAHTAANVDKEWIGTNAAERFSTAIGGAVTVVNDADAAGIAEVTFGAGRDRGGVVIMVTLGTGIGSAVFHEGALVPNTELGHLKMGKHDAERLAAESVRESEDLSWKDWAGRLNDYFAMLERLFSPDLFIIGGGVSKKSEKFVPFLETTADIIPAQLLNEAGIVGAAVAHDLRSPALHTD